ncbi:hypothetical protein M378DRAFT_17245 [Amanita muscaria Koide BX008]|uniref:BHLH domain-containing protein n=1 Tax=Amanita muscaria (strain Koide BX008) TaxID=946122 RepID=A0A0C2WHY8_AMAMK|nr:hypothetical protein M378DRAFT_17245 [Amanita muscaria Koide BX008]
MDSDRPREDTLQSFFPGDYVLAGAPGTYVHQLHHHQLSERQNRRMFSSSGSQLAPENPQQMDVAQQYPPQPQASLQSQTQINLDMLGDLAPMSMPGMDLNSSQDSNSNSISQMVAGGGQLGYIPQVFIDQQYRLSQLHQLQQLQQHIFQQQIALLSGQASGLLNGAPTFDTQRDQSLIFNGIPTPAPSGELRPQQQSLDFIAPMALNSLGDSASQGHPSGTSLPNSPATLHSAPGSAMSSPVFLASNNGYPSSNTFSTTPYVQARSVSAPEHIAFQNHGLPPATDLDLDISPLTSPWLGAQPNQPIPPLSNQLQNKGQSRQNQIYTRQQPDHSSSASASPTLSQAGHQYPSTPVAGPIPMSNNATNTNNKRSASPSSTETDARKKQSPAIRPTNPGVFSPYLDQQPSARRSNRTSTRSASTSTSSTPHLRGRSASARQRKGSTAATPVIHEVPVDSPSPVDLSMPPPAPPNSAIMGSSIGTVPSSLAVAPLTPVTPASIMNLDTKGKRLKIVTDTPGGVSPASPATSRSKRGTTQGNMTAGPSLISPSLKPILPGPSNVLAITPASSANGNHPSPAMSALSIGPPQVRKSSHKAAEQKRRDSLKTTFDELRGLLPPIPLPSTPGTGNGDEDGGANGAGGVAPGTGGSGGSGSTGGNLFGNAVKPLLPGALPPRGPPKAGGEGPNKSVSKLQLLICGNEFIRTLKSRVDRRDEEIALLRREVRNLRQLKQFLGVVAGIQAANPGFEGDAAAAGGGPARGGQEGGAGVDLGTMGFEGLLEELDLELDLDRDIDAVEKMSGLINGALTGSGRRDDLLSSARSDITMDEDPVEDDED